MDIFGMSFFKKDPMKEKLKQAKKIRKAKDKLFWIEQERERKEEKRIFSFLYNNICPECGGHVTLEQTVDATGVTDNHYKCTKCPFEKHYFCDDEDDF